MINTPKEDSDDFVQILRDNDLHDIRGPKAKIVKFDASMCQNCNNARSQTYDHAFSDFLDFVLNNTWRFEIDPVLRWDEIYSGKTYDQRHLARYFIKNLACRAVEKGVEVPDEWIAFMDSIDVESSFDLVPFSDYRLIRAMKNAGMKHLDPNFAQVGAYPNFDDFNDAEGEKFFVGELLDGAIGIYFEWRKYPEIGESMLGRSISAEKESVILDRGLVPYRELHNTMDAVMLRFEEVARERAKG